MSPEYATGLATLPKVLEITGTDPDVDIILPGLDYATILGKGQLYYLAALWRTGTHRPSNEVLRKALRARGLIPATFPGVSDDRYKFIGTIRPEVDGIYVYQVGQVMLENGAGLFMVSKKDVVGWVGILEWFQEQSDEGIGPDMPSILPYILIALGVALAGVLIYKVATS